jgi:hypothetical protein
MISAVQLRHRRDAYYVIDIREAEEIAQDPLVVEEDEDMIRKDDDDEQEKEEEQGPEGVSSDKATAVAAQKLVQSKSYLKADIEVPMGKLLAMGIAEEWIQQHGIVLVCNTGYRAMITARELVVTRNKLSTATKVMALQHGILGVRNPAAVSPSTVIVLATHSDPEKITLALNAAAVAATTPPPGSSTTTTTGGTIVLALLGDGVSTFLRKGSNKTIDKEKTMYLVNETFIGEPFQPCQALLKKFVGSGNGMVLACKSCLAKRGLELGSDLVDCVEAMQMPDLLRMMDEAHKTLQFM